MGNGTLVFNVQRYVFPARRQSSGALTAATRSVRGVQGRVTEPGAQRSHNGSRVICAGHVADTDRSQNRRTRLLNQAERLGQRGPVAAIEVNVLASSVCDLESDRLPNDKSHGLGFEFPCIARGRDGCLW